MLMTFHHIGVACRDLESETEAFRLLGYEAEAEDFLDPRQGIRGRFLIGSGPRLELLVGLPGSSVLTPWLKKGLKFYHQAFVVQNLGVSVEELCEKGGRLVSPPIRAAAFGGQQIAFVMLRNMSLVELIQGDVQSHA
jgi:methylmalonyl-CoA/ethylmalonyl-CoA epimerase